MASNRSKKNSKVILAEHMRRLRSLANYIQEQKDEKDLYWVHRVLGATVSMLADLDAIDPIGPKTLDFIVKVD